MSLPRFIETSQGFITESTSSANRLIMCNLVSTLVLIRANTEFMPSVENFAGGEFPENLILIETFSIGIGVPIID